ncbi:Aste57867_21977 [Aphanomyces stellatus]|uniref:Aste57867_21977 protein n=1 Tax=Aphanomyces stellatus TaxID=120398 RepID=A0A485LJ04_9STRA|nr:hypothetical protein As57867_021908 [Aphanomyces stellatus]VFT98645.1 Aste57867_21977 [Aphanomyces stellatus]
MDRKKMPRAVVARKGRGGAAVASPPPPVRKKSVTADVPLPSAPSTKGEENNVVLPLVDVVEEPPIKEVPDWRVQCGFLNETDKLFRAYPCTKKPRMPNPSDEKSWIDVMLPRTEDEFLNNPVALQDMADLCTPIEKFAAGTNILVTGKDLSGKTSFVQLFIQRMYPEADDRRRRILALNAATMDEGVLLSKMDHFKRSIDKAKPHVKLPYVVIENFHALNPRIQQHTIGPQWEVLNQKRIFFVLTAAPDSNKVTEQIKSSSKIIRLQSLDNPLHILHKLLLICATQRIGYVRPAIEYLLKRKRQLLGPSILALQQLFLRYHFVSIENTNRFFKRPLALLDTLEIVDMCAPLKRCRVCTLVPPCQHTTLQHLYDRVTRLRAMYPQDNQRDVCPDFRHTGVCHVFHRKGRCLFDHPLDIHVIDTTRLVERCAVHTLPLPCTHCATLEATHAREKGLEKDKADAQKEIRRLKKMLADVDHALHAHRKGSTDAVVWGKAKEVQDAKADDFMTEMARLRRQIDATTHKIDAMDPVLQALHAKNARGFAKGLGKGHGRLQPGVDAPSSVDEEDAAAAIAAIQMS